LETIEEIVEVTIQGEDIKSEPEFHVAISKALNFSSYYGKNLDALWDVLSTDVERPLTLIWKNSQLSKAHLANTFEKIVGILKRVEAQDAEWGLAEKFTIKLE
jgi:ribonuclease inhibitor